MKIILGRPVSRIHRIEHEIDTMDLGVPDKQITMDGRLVEVPNADYVARTEASFTTRVARPRQESHA